MFKSAGRVLDGRYIVGYRLVDECNPDYVMTCDLGNLCRLAERGLISDLTCRRDPKTGLPKFKDKAGAKLNSQPDINIRSEIRQEGIKYSRTGKFNEICTPVPLTNLVNKLQTMGTEIPVDISKTVTTAYLMGEYPSNSGYVYSMRRNHSPGVTQIVYRNPDSDGTDNVLRVTVRTLIGHREIRMAAAYGLLMTKAFGSRQVTAVVEVTSEGNLIFAEYYSLK